MILAMMSVDPPGGHGTIIRMGLLGHDGCAIAGELKEAARTPKGAAPKICRRFMVSIPSKENSTPFIGDPEKTSTSRDHQ
jgi:hypothetical protein